MSSCIQRIVSLAKKAISSSKGKAFELDDQLLKALNALSIHELLFDPKEPFDTHKGLPAYYVDIYEDRDVSIGMFFLNGSSKIPLHDHPRMTGIIKCIAGTLKISSYSPIEHEMNEDNLTLAIPHEDVVLSPSSDPKMLTPMSHNIHEMKNVSSSSPSAFLDILTPPYNVPDLPDFSPNEEIRLCNYYEVVKKDKQELPTNFVSLRIIEQPDEFICRSFKFL